MNKIVFFWNEIYDCHNVYADSETPRVKTRGFFLNNPLYVAPTRHAREGGHPESDD
jgi:hypothetical protein